jgi:Protein of unknown function (DUF3141)
VPDVGTDLELSRSINRPPSSTPSEWWTNHFIHDGWAYWIDACQRTALLAQILQRRSQSYERHAAKVAPHVLKFDCELLIDGRKLTRPANYALARIVPPSGIKIDPSKRPFVVVDPRAGHGPGIGGFKSDSEVGVALRAGHPCYFIGFLPEPVPGQSIEDVAHVQAAFLEHVISLHPQAVGKPAVIGNCQAGWALMLLAAVRPELFGPIIVAGSPLSYWAGVRGQYPLRYTGGLLGGTWLTALMGDLGNGRFDGAWLVSNFENLNPTNTLWTKHYNLYSKVDTEEARYLEFEEWWGGHVLLNAGEMQFIVDELFVGNKLATGEILSSDGNRIDLRNVRSPIVVFCSKADNITPPPQALGWICDLYDSVEDIRVHGQTIVYAIHETIGHLGIFVSASVAKKEHGEFTSNIDLIDVLPPGLYEAVMTARTEGDGAGDLIDGDYLVRFEARDLQDIRDLCAINERDERKFATVARVSEINLGLYRTIVQPWIRCWANEAFATWLRQLHPLRLQHEIFSHTNALLRSLGPLGDQARKYRQPVPKDNPFWEAQERVSDAIETTIEAYRELRDHTAETLFDMVYGSPLLQAMVGLKASDRAPRRRLPTDPAHRALVAQRIRELKENISKGGPREAAIRALLYIRLPDGAIDERGFNFLRRMRDTAGKGLSLDEFKTLVREQFYMLLLDQRTAVAAIPTLLARDRNLASLMISHLYGVIEVVGLTSGQAKARLAKIESLVDVSTPREGASESTSLARSRRLHTAKHSKPA